MAKSIKPLYTSNKLTKNSKPEMWVTFRAGRMSDGYVYSSTLTRDEVRNATAKQLGVAIQDIRSRRVSNYRKG